MGDIEGLLKQEKTLAAKKGKVKHAIRNLIVEKNALITSIGEWYLKSRTNDVSAEAFEAKFLEASKAIELVDENIAIKITDKKSVYTELKELEDKLEELR